MKVFSFDTQHGVGMEPINVNNKDSNISLFNDPTWSQTDYRDPTFDYSYASSSSSFSCSSLTSGNVTPQSSVSASTSRRQSLVSSAIKSMSIFDASAQTKSFRRPRTPVTLNDPYSTRHSMANTGYPCTAPTTSPTSQGLETIFTMEMDDPIFSGKLQSGIDPETVNSAQASSFSDYEGLDMTTQAFLGQESKSVGSAYLTNQYTNSLCSDRSFPYQAASSVETYSQTNHNLMAPQTVMPSETTYQVGQPMYTVPQTPPRVLGEGFISPSRSSFGNSPEEQLQMILGQSEGLDFSENVPDNEEDLMLQSLELPQSATKLEYTDDESSSYSQSTDRSPCSDGRPFIARRRRYRKRDASSGSAGSSRKREQKEMTVTVKKESLSKHACPICKHRPGEAKIQFKRPEHLNRHMASVHGDANEKIQCRVPNCKTSILNRIDNMNTHYKNTHMYGPCEVKGKKRIFLSIPEAKALGLGHIDPRTNPQTSKSRSKAVK